MTAHYQKGNENKVAFVFSCPGRHEEAEGYPAAQNTGTNLINLLLELSRIITREDLIREYITIANAWDRIEYDKKTNRSEATNKEILLPSNILRLANELSHVEEFVVFCGEKAKIASEQLIQQWSLKKQPLFLFIDHLGIKGLNNSILYDIDGNKIVKATDQIATGNNDAKSKIQSENTKKRLQVVANNMAIQLITLKQADAK